MKVIDGYYYRSSNCITGNIDLLQHKCAVIIAWNVASFIDNVNCVHSTVIIRNRSLSYSDGGRGNIL